MERTIEVNEKVYTEQEIREAIQNFKYAWESIVEIVSNVIGEITKIIQSIIDKTHENIHKEVNVRYHMPLKIVPNLPNVDIPKVKIPKIRNNI